LKLKLKLKSGALQFTVFIAVLIALLLAGLILYAYTFIYMKEQSKGAIENIQFADIGMQSLLEQKELSLDTAQIDFIKKENQSIKTNLSQWGIFQKGIVVTQFRKKKFTKTAIIGSLINADLSPTLFLKETHNALTVVGTTSIRGIAYLPTQGVNSGYIAGNSYYGSQLIYGSIKKSTAELPKPEKTVLETLANYFKTYKIEIQQDYIDLNASSRIINSFKSRTKGYYSQNPIVLENKIISGNIIIKSETSIKIKKTALLTDVIIIAPIIEIEDETVGNFQALASKKITMGKKCNLSYPSALVLSQDNKNTANEISTIPFDNQIFIDAGSIVRGTVCYLQTKEIADFQTQIVLEKEAKIKGQVYCNGNFEIKGTVSGSVYTKQFVANQSGSIFMNHVYNATIENENVPKFYGGIILEQEPKTVLKWLY
jgi:cytoskeletal protein CcmA (bactofilin family)